MEFSLFQGFDHLAVDGKGECIVGIGANKVTLQQLPIVLSLHSSINGE
jgi:hypothetical protein